MTYQTAKPRYTIHFDGKDYDVEGSFQLIDAIEWALKDSIINIVVRTINNMSMGDTAKLLSVVLNSAGEKLTPAQIGQILFEKTGVYSLEYTALCIELHQFIVLMMSKPSAREEVHSKMGKTLGELEAMESLASRGLITGESA